MIATEPRKFHSTEIVKKLYTMNMVRQRTQMSSGSREKTISLKTKKQ